MNDRNDWARRAAVLLSNALAACGTPEDPTPVPRTGPSPFVFELSGEPGRSRAGYGAILDDRMVYRMPAGAGWYQAAIDTRQRSGTTRQLRIRDITVTIDAGGCRGNVARPDRITISAPAAVYRGCGGPRIVPTAIAGTTWTLRELDGQPAPTGSSPAATLTFGQSGTIGGTNACNDVGGGIRWRAGRFERPAAPYDLPVSTVMACREPSGGEFGGRFWNRMMQARTWRRDGATMWITFADGSRAGLALIL